MANYIFMTGGVVSSLGKGIVVASLGRMLKSRNVKVALVKLDPYLNVDPGTMSPYQHGEVFVTADGTETDLDLGHYERFTDINVSRDSNITSGLVYKKVLKDERDGKTKGLTVQITPHVTDKIKDCIKKAARKSKADVVIVEVGGTVGDIEGQPFLEAIRQMKKDKETESAFYIHLTLLPYLKTSEELKTKPTQHSVQALRSAGIQPDAIICRAEREVGASVRKKIALYCDVQEENVIGLPDLPNVYQVPFRLEEEGLGGILSDLLGCDALPHYSEAWKAVGAPIDEEQLPQAKQVVKIGIVGKYVQMKDCYLSVVEALAHSEATCDVSVELHWVDGSDIEAEGPSKLLRALSGILVPGGFDKRGVEGMVAAASYARTNKIPYLGLCLGLQAMVIDVAKNVMGLAQANSMEFDKSTPDPVISTLPGQEGKANTGASMRRGTYRCRLVEGSISSEAYGVKDIKERHRHRWEVNGSYVEALERNGLKVAGLWEEANVVEIMEADDHPFMVGVQFHPEFLSRPDKPHPLFLKFVEMAKHTVPHDGQIPLPPKV